MAGSYSRTVEGADTIFHVVPGVPTGSEKSARPINNAYIIGGVLLCLTGCGAVAGVPLIVLALMQKGRTGPNMVMGHKAAFLCPATIRVTPNSIVMPPEFPNQGAPAQIALSDVHRLVVRNYPLEAQGYATTTIVGGGAVGGAQQMGMAYRLQVAKDIGWGVDMEVGGRAYTIACGLDEVAARGLMEDISRSTGA